MALGCSTRARLVSRVGRFGWAPAQSKRPGATSRTRRSGAPGSSSARTHSSYARASATPSSPPTTRPTARFAIATCIDMPTSSASAIARRRCWTTRASLRRAPRSASTPARPSSAYTVDHADPLALERAPLPLRLGEERVALAARRGRRREARRAAEHSRVDPHALHVMGSASAASASTSPQSAREPSPRRPRRIEERVRDGVRSSARGESRATPTRASPRRRRDGRARRRPGRGGSRPRARCGTHRRVDVAAIAASRR